MARVGVVGGGAWGTAIAAHATRLGHDTCLWAFERDVVEDVAVRHVNSIFLPDVRLPEVLRAKETFQRTMDKRGKKSQQIMLAYVLMKVPGKEVDAVMEELKVCREVVEASTVYGESDIVAKVQVKDQKELDSLVMGRIHGIPAVESTRTFIVVERLHWER